MKIKKTERYDKKEFIVLEYCCMDMAKEMKECPVWEIEEGQMFCFDGECGIGGKYCSECGQKIEIIE
jgi:hypothetical protein